MPEAFITYMNALTVEPIELYSCFISYSNKDQEFAKRLYGDLQNENIRWLTCWSDDAQVTTVCVCGAGDEAGRRPHAGGPAPPPAK
ncbi:MAG TPA: hypothetical protein VF621_05980 [Pyrinomonadaceae bacterium]